MILDLANQVSVEQNATPTAAAIFAALADPLRTFNGASGVLGFGSRAQGHQIAGKPVVLATVAEDGRLQVSAVCGRLTPEAHQSADCPPQEKAGG